MAKAKLKEGVFVVTSPSLGRITGTGLNPRWMLARRPDAIGIVLEEVGGSEGRLWLVLHFDSKVAIYLTEELRKAHISAIRKAIAGLKRNVA